MTGSVLSVRYEVREEKESNALFETFSAYDKSASRDVKIRIVASPYSDEPAFIEALGAYVGMVHGLQTNHVEKVSCLERDGDIHFLVSEDAGGITLEERIKRLASFSVQLALQTAIGVCTAVSELHQAGVVHGDIAARNVLVQPTGATKLMLPGLWQTLGASSKAGLVMLRPMAPYLAPEVTAGGMPSASSDIYSIGVLLYQMLAGRFPYSGDSSSAIAAKHATAPVPSLRQTNSSVPMALDELVKKAMSKSPPDRYRDVGSLLNDLRTLSDALRFGKPLHWPIRQDTSPPPAVAPELNAVEPPPDPKKKIKPARAKKERNTDGVPGWITGVVYLFVAAALLLVGGWVFHNLQQPKLVSLPKIVGMPASEASKHLEDMGLQMSVVREEVNDKVAAGVVIDQRPAPGAKKIRENGIVEVVVSSGSRFVAVPDLRGRTTEEARQVLEAMNLELSDDIERVRDKELAVGLIVSQLPEHQKKVERYSKIKVTISNGDETPPEVRSPNGRYTYKLQIKMPGGDQPVIVQVDMTDKEGTRTVHDEEHIGGESFQVEAEGVGGEAMFRIFFDGELVKQVTKKAADAEQGEQ